MFGAYFYSAIEYRAFEELCAVKTRKQFMNCLRTLYGKKKDRGRCKEKYKKLCEEIAKENAIIAKALYRRFYESN